MSTAHGPVTQRSIADVARYMKNLIPAHIPEIYDLKPRFAEVADEDEIRNGIVAYRDFLYLFFDRIISEGDLYFKQPRNPKHAADYPFLYVIADLLADIGYNGIPAEGGLSIPELPSFTASVDRRGNKKNAKNSGPRLMAGIRFLTLCGFVFPGVDTEARTLSISGSEPLKVSYPENPVLLTGLKAMSIADIELRVKRYKNDNNRDNLLRCDYWLLKAGDTDAADLLKNFLAPLPGEVRKFASELHQHHVDSGMTCVPIISTFKIHFGYSDLKNCRRKLSSRDVYQRRVWEFFLSPRDGYCIVVRAKKTELYRDAIEKFPRFLQEKIAKGYGCDRKLRNEPCRMGCQGIRLALAESILRLGGDVRIWLDRELSV